VGSIKLDFDEEVLTNKAAPCFPYYEDRAYVKSSVEKAGPFSEYLKADKTEDLATNNNSILLQKGEMTGRFEMGSTIVLVFEASPDTELAISEGERLLMGQKLVSNVHSN
jgi:phosphatidylserine decarboxylase